MIDFNSAYRFISVGALSLPVLWGIIFYMSEATVSGLKKRVEYLESIAAKGERFTQADGDRVIRYVEKHGEEIAKIRLGKAKIRESIAEVRVMQNNVLYRVQRIEDSIYDHNHQEHNGKSSRAPRRHQGKDSEIPNGGLDRYGLCGGIPCVGRPSGSNL